MNLYVEVDHEQDGRWLAEVAGLPGTMAYGAFREAAVVATKALALRVIADRLEHGELAHDLDELIFSTAQRR